MESPGHETPPSGGLTTEAEASASSARDSATKNPVANADIVALDGPSGTGKSTVAQVLARRLDVAYLDTGAMYRAATVAVLDAGVGLDDQEQIEKVVAQTSIRVSTDIDDRRTLLGERDVSVEIRGEAVTAAVSAVSAVPAVRALLVEQQRQLVGTDSAVVEGRDIGTVVFPAAVLKVYLTADAAERARRRTLQTAGNLDSIAAVQQDLDRRDAYDSGRAASPLALAPGAQVIDTTYSSIDEVVERLVDLYLACRDAVTLKN